MFRPTPEGVAHICRHLRAADAAEIFATRWDDDPDDLADEMLRRPLGLVDMAVRDAEPVALVGAVPAWPGVWSVLAFGTDKWDKVAVTLTRHVRRFLIPALVGAGAHRAHCFSAAEHHTAHAWLTRSLGARRGPDLPNFGKNGETFVVFEWSREDANRRIGA